MDSIDNDTMQNVGSLIDMLDRSKTGDIHTVTVTLNGQHGGADVKIECSQSHDIHTVIK